jgi:hypothetical protein
MAAETVHYSSSIFKVKSLGTRVYDLSGQNRNLSLTTLVNNGSKPFRRLAS